MPLKSLNHTFFLLPNIYLNLSCLTTPLRCGKCLKKRKSGKRKKGGRKRKKGGRKRKKRSGKLNTARAENTGLFPFSLIIKQF